MQWLDFMHSLVAIPWVQLLVVENWVLSSKWRQTRLTKKPSVMGPDVSADLFQKLQVITCHICMYLLHIALVSMSYIIKCSVLDEERWSPASFHHVKTAFLCMSSVPTTTLPFGGWRVNPLCQVKEYRWKTDDNGKLAIEWMRGTPAPDAVLQLLSCKYCVRVCDHANCQTAHAF